MCKVKTNEATRNQEGMVSIIVALVLMVVLSLLVIGFAQLARREQRQSLDKQLSNQAFYAAESGINDSISVMNNWLASNDPKLDQDYLDDCDEFTSAAVANLNNSVNAANQVTYSCLLVDPTPVEQVYDDVPMDKSRVLYLERKDNLPVGNVKIFWENSETDTDFNCVNANNERMPTISNWDCDPPMIRIDIVDFSSPKDGTALVDDTMTIFVRPSDFSSTSPSAASYAYIPGLTTGFGNSGSRAPGSCQASVGKTKSCQIAIPLTATGTKYYMRIRPIYASADVVVCAGGTIDDPNCDDSQELIGNQVVVDATGKATDVIRRVLVHSSLKSTVEMPEYPLAADDICKQFSLIPPSTYTPTGCTAPSGSL